MHSTSHRCVWLAALVLASLALDAAAGVLVVGPGGFPDLQPAVDAAQDGDLILVEPGAYAGFTITNKSLEIHADPSATIGSPIVVENLDSGKLITLRGIAAHMSTGTPVVALTILHCEGAVWLEDSSFEGGAVTSSEVGPGAAGLRVNDSARVVAVRCSFIGGTPWSTTWVAHGSSPPAGKGAQVKSSNVAFFECLIQAGDIKNMPDWKNCSPGTDGATGLSITGSSTVILEEVTCLGGDGQHGGSCLLCPPTGNGGAGMGTSLAVPPGGVKIRDSVVLGGYPGLPGLWCTSPALRGPPFVGPPDTYDFLPGTTHSLAVPGPLREGTQATIEISGLPNEAVLLLADPGVGGLAAWPFPGFLALGNPPAVATMLPPLPPSGTVSIPLSVPSLPPSVQGIAIGLQALMSDLTSTRPAALSSPSRVLLLDSAF